MVSKVFEYIQKEFNRQKILKRKQKRFDYLFFVDFETDIHYSSTNQNNKKKINQIKVNFQKGMAEKDNYVKEIGTHSLKFNSIIVRQIAFLKNNGIQLSRDCIIYHFNLNQQTTESIYDQIIKEMQSSTCRIIMADLILSSQQISYLIYQMSNLSHLTKIHIQMKSDETFNLVLIPNLISECIKLYDKSDNLIYLNIKFQLNQILINKESNHFQLLLINQFDYNTEEICLFPQSNRCFFKTVQLDLGQKTFSDCHKQLLEFLDQNAFYLTKFSFQCSTLLDWLLSLILNKITEINKLHQKLDFVYFNYFYIKSVNLINLSYDLIKNQNIDHFKCDSIGLHKNSLTFLYNSFCKKMYQPFIFKILKEIPKISKIFIQGESNLVINAIRTLIDIPPKRIQIIFNRVDNSQEKQLLKLMFSNPYYKYMILQGYEDSEKLKGFFEYQNEIDFYIILYFVLTKHLQSLVYHRIKNSFIDLYVDS